MRRLACTLDVYPPSYRRWSRDGLQRLPFAQRWHLQLADHRPVAMRAVIDLHVVLVRQPVKAGAVARWRDGPDGPDPSWSPEEMSCHNHRPCIKPRL